MNAPVLALDVGGTAIKSGLVDARGCRELPLIDADAQGDAEAILAALAAALRQGLVAAEEEGGTVAGVGIAICGPFDYARGVSLMRHKFAALHGRDLAAGLRAALPALAGLPIRFLHDANAFLLGELRAGAALGARRAGGITLGTGLGAAFCAEGRLRNGPTGSPAPEVSLWSRPYAGGTVEERVSGRALAARWGGDPAGGARAVAEAAAGGDPRALAAFAAFGADLGAVLAPWCRDLQPEVLVIGGRIAQALPLFRAPLLAALADLPAPPPVHAARLGGQAALLGAAASFAAAP